MKFLRAVYVQLRQALSWPLALCAVLYAVMSELSVAGLIAMGPQLITVWNLAQSNGSSLLTLFILPTLPFAMSIAMDWDSRAVPYWVAREGAGRYTVSKLLVSALSGFLTVGLGLIIFVLANGAFFPWYRSCSGADYEQLFEGGHIFLGWLGYILHMSLSGALIGALGMLTSIFVPNRFVAVSAPLAIHLTVLRIMPTELISPISVWYPTNWVEGIHCTLSPWRTLIEKLLITAGFCILMCIGGCICMRRRLENG